MLKIVKVLVPAGCALVCPQVAQGNQVYLLSIQRDDFARRIALGETDTVNPGQNFNTHGRYAHTDNLAGLKEDVWLQFDVLHAEAAKHVNKLGCVLRRDRHSNVHVGRCSRIAMETDSISADQ
jgi:hypothetical protein